MGKTSNLLSDLLQIDVFKVGEFVLKGNHSSPFYIDLRHVPSHPRVANNVVRDIHFLITDRGLSVDAVCGVPYNALPFAAVLSSRHEIPMILKRKEAKTYGTKKLIEGVIVQGAKCLIIEDVVVSGASIKETAEALRKEGLVVTDCVTILDRLQGGKDNLLKFGIHLHSLFNINDILDLYSSINEIKPSVVERVRQYLSRNVCSIQPMAAKTEVTKKTCNPVLKRLFEIVERKRSNLCVSIEVERSLDLLRIAEAVAPHVCILKTHVDVLVDFTHNVTSKLSSLAKQHDFLILEDRKFSDEGDKLMYQYQRGMYDIVEWADIVTVHALPGSDVLESLKRTANRKDRGCLLVAQMCSTGALTDDHYVKQVVQLAESNPDFVVGFLGQERLDCNGEFVHFVKEDSGTPEEAVARGADIVVVGRSVCGSSNITQAVIEYKNGAYNAYLKSR